MSARRDHAEALRAFLDPEGFAKEQARSAEFLERIKATVPARDAAEPALTALKWTSERPTEPGFYWHRQRIDANWLEPVVVEVSSYGQDGLHVHEHAVVGAAPLHMWRGEWAGPLEAP